MVKTEVKVSYKQQLYKTLQWLYKRGGIEMTITNWALDDNTGPEAPL
jgi:hypothetical protein